MRVITAPEEYIPKTQDICVFLAGGITDCRDWQKDVIKTFEQLAADNEKMYEYLVLFNPRRDNFPIHDSNAASEQIKWEFNALNNCDIFSMYFCGDTKSNQPICFYELGRNLYRMQQFYTKAWQKHTVITVEKELAEPFCRAQDVYEQVKLTGGIVLNSLYEHIKQINMNYQQLKYETLTASLWRAWSDV